MLTRILAGRDPDYQKLAIKGLLGNAKRVLGATKSEDKIAAIKAGVAHLESWLDEFEAENRSKLNLAYLPADVVAKAARASEDELAIEFGQVYADKPVNGNYKHLRTLFPSTDSSASWDIVRNRKLHELKENLAKDSVLFDASGAPTSAHLALIRWAWSPAANKVKAWALASAASNKRKTSDSSSRSEEEDDDDLSSDEDEVPKRRKVE